jgi:hypothetical protein
MPVISMFYGIIIRMYMIDNHHNLPHFHARYAEFEASLALLMERYLLENYPENNCGWYRHG